MVKRLVVVVVEGLGTNLVECYGNSWIQQPALNRVASRSLVLDNLFLHSGSLLHNYRCLWDGCVEELESVRPKENAQVANTRPALFDWATSSGIETQIITDDPVLLEEFKDVSPGATLFTPRPSAEDVEAVGDTSVGQFFLQAMQIIARDNEQPQVLWFHTRGLCQSWDAPYAMRQDLADPEDPDPPTEKEPPEFAIDDSTDPDIVTGWMQAAGAQAMLIDQCLSGVDLAIEESSNRDETMLIVLGLGGYSLGEHRYVGIERAPWYSERIACTCFIRPAEQWYAGQRLAVLTQLADLLPVIKQWFSAEDLSTVPVNEVAGVDLSATLFRNRGPQPPTRWSNSERLAVFRSGDCTILRTPAWLYRVDGLGNRAELFAKPDDRWDQNNVATRAVAIVDSMEQYWEGAKEIVARGDRGSIPEMDVDLAVPVN